jgi:hypothetical protein
MRRVLVWGKLFCRNAVLCGRVGESLDRPNTGRREPMEKERWHECPKATCDSIFDGDTQQCPACGTENPKELSLTLKEVVELVWPNWRRIWTKQPSRFNEPVAEVRRAMAEVSARREQDFKAVLA